VVFRTLSRRVRMRIIQKPDGIRVASSMTSPPTSANAIPRQRDERVRLTHVLVAVGARHPPRDAALVGLETGVRGDDALAGTERLAATRSSSRGSSSASWVQQRRASPIR